MFGNFSITIIYGVNRHLQYAAFRGLFVVRQALRLLWCQFISGGRSLACLDKHAAFHKVLKVVNGRAGG